MRRALLSFLSFGLVLALAGPAAARPAWKVRIDRLVANRSISVAVGKDGRALYRHSAAKQRIPASNQKLLLSMALLDRMALGSRIGTAAAAESPVVAGVVDGNLWLLGHGDPTVTGGGRFGRQLGFPATRLGRLARAIQARGITRITGSVMGSTSYFARDWWAPGWKSDFPWRWIPLPTALSFEGNVHQGRHISNPEFRAARSLTRKLENLGVSVVGTAGSGAAPATLHRIARVTSQPLSVLLGYMNVQSSNFFAEVLGKKLGLLAGGRPGTIAKGAAAIAGWAARWGESLVARDSSGLSYENRVSPATMVDLLDRAEEQPWGRGLRRTLPVADQGTLEDRLAGVKVRAKTGSLEFVSTISGWVWLRQSETWADFSIMSRGMYKSTAAGIEDQIIRTLTRYARA